MSRYTDASQVQIWLPGAVLGLVLAAVSMISITGIGWPIDTARAAPDVDCAPPLSGDWIITSDCTLRVSYGAHGNVRVSDDATLELTDGAILGVDFSTASLRIDKGAKVEVDPGSRVAPLLLELAGLEVTQAIQDLEGTMRSIAGKETYVRAYLQSIGAPVENVAVRLRGFSNGTELSGSPLTPSPASLAQVSANVLQPSRPIVTSANFRLPADWRSGTVTYRVEVAGEPLRCAEQAGTDRDCQAVVAYQFRRQPVVWLAPMDTGQPGTPQLPLAADIVAEQDLMEAMYPVPSITFRRLPNRFVGPANTVAMLQDLRGLYGNTVLAWLFGFLVTGQPPFTLPDQVYGMTAGPIPFPMNPPVLGISDPLWISPLRTGRVAVGTRRQAGGALVGATLAHEINHNLDRSTNGTWGRHAPNCGAAGPDPNWPRPTDNIGVPSMLGFDATDPANPAVRPVIWPDLMSGCISGTQPSRWVSDYRWQRIEFPANTAGVPLDLASEALLQERGTPEVVERVHLDLQLDRDGSGQILDASVLPSIEAASADPDGLYRVAYVTRDGAESFSLNFDVSFEDVHGGTLERVRGLLRLPVAEDLAEIALYRGAELLDQFRVSATAPTVEVNEPDGGERWTDVGVARWAAADPDGDALKARVFYSPEEHVWQIVANDLHDERLEIPVETLPGSESARIRVLVSDGYHTAMDDSDETFVVGAKPPEVTIISPEEGSEFGFWDHVPLRADAFDVEDGTLDGDRVVWTMVGRFGTIAIGDRASVAAARLGPGTRELHVTVTDRDGNRASDSVQVTVRDPAARIHLPRLEGEVP